MITSEKVKAIAIITHTLINSRVKDGLLVEEDNLYKLSNKNIEILKNDLLELVDSFEKINLTKNILNISSNNISINRITYYYSVGLKQIEIFNQKNENFSSFLLSILLLINLLEENKINNIRVDKQPSELFNLYIDSKIPIKEIKKLSILADNIYNNIKKANFAKMIKKKR
jgi:hypothetical protein